VSDDFTSSTTSTPFTPDEILGRLEAFVRAKFEVEDDDPDFDENVHLFDYGYVDSFGAVAVTTFVKEQFGVEIRDQDLVVHSLNTLREITTFVANRRKELALG